MWQQQQPLPCMILQKNTAKNENSGIFTAPEYLVLPYLCFNSHFETFGKVKPSQESNFTDAASEELKKLSQKAQ